MVGFSFLFLVFKFFFFLKSGHSSYNFKSVFMLAPDSVTSSPRWKSTLETRSVYLPHRPAAV